MDKAKLIELLNAVAAGRVTPAEAAERLRRLPYEDLGFARVDTHRTLRVGFPEVVFCEGKTATQAAEVVARLAAEGGVVLATRVDASAFEEIRTRCPGAKYHEQARAVVVGSVTEGERAGLVVVVAAGTADIPVAEEAAVTADAMACNVERLYDVGVAGLHRLLDKIETLHRADCLIVVAGMEGALPSVVAGLGAGPVIAVPTSVGYGASFGGVAALLAMLNSCAGGVAVVNIDNGFGAGFIAGLIARRRSAEVK